MSQTALAELKKLLIDEIPLDLEAAKIKKKVCCIRLYFFDTSAPCAYLVLKVIFERERKDLYDESGNAAYEFWAASEQFGSGPEVLIGGEHQPQFRVEEVLNTIYKSLGSNAGIKRYRKALAQVCMTLNGIDWNDHLKITDDFTISIADGSAVFDDEWPDLSESIPASKLEMLQDNEFLGEGDTWDMPGGVAEDSGNEHVFSQMEQLDGKLDKMPVAKQREFCLKQLQFYIDEKKPKSYDFGDHYYFELLQNAKGVEAMLELAIENAKTNATLGRSLTILSLFRLVRDWGFQTRQIEKLLCEFVAVSDRMMREAKDPRNRIDASPAANCLRSMNRKKYPFPSVLTKSGARLLENVEAFTY